VRAIGWRGGGGGGGARGRARALALERMRTYMPEWTEMSLHQHTTVLRTGCVWVCEWVDVCGRDSVSVQVIKVEKKIGDPRQRLIG
jgi:hypothetical protein